MSNNFKRATHDALGRRIKYADSPTQNPDGSIIAYEQDHSDPSKYDQVTGYPVGLDVAVSVTNRQLSDPRLTESAPIKATFAAAMSSEPSDDPTAAWVTAATSSGLESPPTLKVDAGTTVFDAALSYGRSYGLADDSVGFIGGLEVPSDLKLKAGDILTMKVPVKKRGDK